MKKFTALLSAACLSGCLLGCSEEATVEPAPIDSAAPSDADTMPPATDAEPAADGATP